MVIGFVTKLVRTITLKRVIIWTLAMLLGVAGYTAFERREELFQASIVGKHSGNEVGMTFKIGETTKSEIEDLVNSDESIIGVAVLSADLRLNTRTAVFIAKDPLFDVPTVNTQLSKLPLKLPLFTKDEENNRLMLKLINGEFYCAPYNTAAMSRSVARVTNDPIVVCRASLPPYYGHFAGFVAVFLNVDPDVEQQLRRKQQIELIATKIFFRDVVPSKHKERIN